MQMIIKKAALSRSMRSHRRSRPYRPLGERPIHRCDVLKVERLVFESNVAVDPAPAGDTGLLRAANPEEERAHKMCDCEEHRHKEDYSSRVGVDKVVKFFHDAGEAE